MKVSELVDLLQRVSAEYQVMISDNRGSKDEIELVALSPRERTVYLVTNELE